MFFCGLFSNLLIISLLELFLFHQSSGKIASVHSDLYLTVLRSDPWICSPNYLWQTRLDLWCRTSSQVLIGWVIPANLGVRTRLICSIRPLLWGLPVAISAVPMFSVFVNSLNLAEENAAPLPKLFLLAYHISGNNLLNI